VEGLSHLLSLRCLRGRRSRIPSSHSAPAAPNFELPGVDGATHNSRTTSSGAVLVVVFTAIIVQSRKCTSVESPSLRQSTRTAASLWLRFSRMIRRQSGSMNWIPPDISDSLERDEDPGTYKHLTYPYLYDWGDAGSNGSLRPAGDAARICF